MERERPLLRRASCAEILPLRHAVLRPGLPVHTATFSGDEDPETRHYGAFAPGGEVLGCLSLMRRDRAGRAAFQLRGMATRADRCGSGIGRDLLAYAIAALAEETGVRDLWCNARIESAGFYERQGWETISAVFDIPGVGPHVVMVSRA